MIISVKYIPLGSRGKPDRIIDQLSDISNTLKKGEEGDPQEFLSCWFEKLPKIRVSLEDIFGGSECSTFECGKCHQSWEKEEKDKFLLLLLGIETSKTIGEALQAYTYEADVQIRCETCKMNVSTKKEVSFVVLPPVLILSLKRYAIVDARPHKVDKHVEFPLDLTMDTKDGLKCLYHLYAIVEHESNAVNELNSGHYRSYIRISEKKWYLFDDSKVSPLSENSVLEKEAYILFYAKDEIESFSDFMSTVINERSARTMSNPHPYGLEFTDPSVEDNVNFPAPALEDSQLFAAFSLNTRRMAQILEKRPTDRSEKEKEICGLYGHAKSAIELFQQVSEPYIVEKLASVSTEEPETPGRPLAKFSNEERELLIEGMLLMPKQWMEIKKSLFPNSRRTRFSLKDQWRQLVKMVMGEEDIQKGKKRRDKRNLPMTPSQYFSQRSKLGPAIQLLLSSATRWQRELSTCFIYRSPKYVYRL